VPAPNGGAGVTPNNILKAAFISRPRQSQKKWHRYCSSQVTGSQRRLPFHDKDVALPIAQATRGLRRFLFFGLGSEAVAWPLAVTHLQAHNLR
ncbi:MAG: hypothetical protein ACRES5_00265, partial [Pseudomonas sp.]